LDAIFGALPQDRSFVPDAPPVAANVNPTTAHMITPASKRFTTRRS
jgi:hypothetical protein